MTDKGFVALSHADRSIHVELQQPAIDYAECAARSAIGWRWEDVTYDLVEERTVLSKLFWVVLGYALGVLSAILLRLLGWIKIGN